MAAFIRITICLRRQANKLGLEFAYLPVVPGQINDTNVADFKTIIDQLPGPDPWLLQNGDACENALRAVEVRDFIGFSNPQSQ